MCERCDWERNYATEMLGELIANDYPELSGVTLDKIIDRFIDFYDDRIGEHIKDEVKLFIEMGVVEAQLEEIADKMIDETR